MTDLIIPPLKKCSKCAAEYPATPDYFHRDKVNRDGLHYHCKVCVRAYHQANRELLIARQIAYQKAHAEKTKEYHRRYQMQNADRIKKNRRKVDPLKNRAYAARWAKNNPDKLLVMRHRRRASKLNLLSDWTAQHWQLCLDYWHNTCAVCGGQLRDLFGAVITNADHWIAMSDKNCPGTTPGNMICLCSTCNNSKKSKAPEIWLRKRYGTRKGNEILKRINNYFQWIMNQEVSA